MLKRSEISINRAHNINMSAQWFRNYKMISLLQKYFPVLTAAFGTLPFPVSEGAAVVTMIV